MLSFTDKKGISEIVSYVLLVVIALGLSVIVYNYLSNYVPKDKAMCEDDIAISISQIRCNSTSKLVTFSYSNKGFFSIDKLYVRLSPETRQVGKNLGDPIDLTPGLNPNQNGTTSLDASSIVSQPGKYILEVEPAVWVKKQLALCENAVNAQQISCSP